MAALGFQNGRSGVPRGVEVATGSLSQLGFILVQLMRTKPQTTISFPRETLLVEIERRCTFTGCGAKNQIGLTKSEAIEYRGFDCEQCEEWNDDRLNQRDIPGSWLEQIPNTQS